MRQQSGRRAKGGGGRARTQAGERRRGLTCSRTGGGRQQGEARRQGKKGCWLCSSSHLSVSINTRRLVCLWFGPLGGGGGRGGLARLSLSVGNAWALQFPFHARLPACLRLLRMEAKETVPCAEQGVTPRRHQWSVENGKRCRNSALLEFNGQGPSPRGKGGKGRGGGVIS